MSRNSFKRLIEEEERNVPTPPLQVKQKLDKTVGVFKFVGDTVELYLSNLMDTLVAMMGGSAMNGQAPGGSWLPEMGRKPEEEHSKSEEDTPTRL